MGYLDNVSVSAGWGSNSNTSPGWGSDNDYSGLIKDAVNLGTGLLTNYLTDKSGKGVKKTLRGKGKQDKQTALEVQQSFVNQGLLTSQAEKAKLSILGSMGAEGTYGPKDDIYGANSPFTKMGSGMQIFDPDKARGLFGTPTTTPSTPTGGTYYGSVPKGKYKYKVASDVPGMIDAMQWFPHGVYSESQIKGKPAKRFYKVQKDVQDQLLKAVQDGKLSQNMYNVIISGAKDVVSYEKLTPEEKAQYLEGLNKMKIQQIGAIGNQAVGMEGYSGGGTFGMTQGSVYFNPPQFGVPGQPAAPAPGQPGAAPTGAGDDLVNPTKFAEAFFHSSMGRTASAQTAMAEQLVNQSGPMYEKIHRQITAPIFDGAVQLGRESMNVLRNMIGRGGSARRAGLREAMEISNALDTRTQLSNALKESELQLFNTSQLFAQQVASFNVNLVEALPLIGKNYQNTLQRLNEFYVTSVVPTVSALRGSAFNAKMKLEQAKMRERLSNTQMIMGTVTSVLSSMSKLTPTITPTPSVNAGSGYGGAPTGSEWGNTDWSKYNLGNW